MESIASLIYFIIFLLTSKIGHQIHGSFFWALVDGWLWPFAWLKWFLYEEVNITIIKNSFSFFLN